MPGVASGSGSAIPQVAPTAKESSGAAAGPSTDTLGGAGGSGSSEPQVAPTAQAQARGPAAKDPRQGPSHLEDAEGDVRPGQSVRQGRPSALHPADQQEERKRERPRWWPPVATPKPKALPPPGKQVAVKATPDQVRALFAGEMQPQTAEDAIGLLRATDAATRPQAHQVAIVDLDTMDDGLDDDPPLPPPPGLPPSSPSPPSKPMPSVPKQQVDQPPKASFPPVAKGEGCSGPGAPPDDGSQQQEGTQAAASRRRLQGRGRGEVVRDQGLPSTSRSCRPRWLTGRPGRLWRPSSHRWACRHPGRTPTWTQVWSFEMSPLLTQM